MRYSLLNISSYEGQTCSQGGQEVNASEVIRNRGRLTSSMCSSCCSRSSFLDVVVMRPAKRGKFIDPNKIPSVTPRLAV